MKEASLRESLTLEALERSFAPWKSYFRSFADERSFAPWKSYFRSFRKKLRSVKSLNRLSPVFFRKTSHSPSWRGRASLVYAFLQGSNLKSLSLASSENLIPLQFLLQAISRQRLSVIFFFPLRSKESSFRVPCLFRASRRHFECLLSSFFEWFLA